MDAVEKLFEAPMGDVSEVATDDMNVGGEDDVQVPTAPVTKGAKKAAKKFAAPEVKAAMSKEIQENPDIVNLLSTESKNIYMAYSLGYGTRGGMIHDKEQSKKEGKRVLVQVPEIVGYQLKNIGDKPIRYQTEVYTQNADGKYVGEVVERELPPDGSVNLTRKYVSILLSRPEFSFTLANGKLQAPTTKVSEKSLDELLEARFYFTGEEKESGRSVNSDEDKILIDSEGPDGTRQLKPEFVETFGFLANETEKAEGKKRSGGRGKSISFQEQFAAYIRSQLAQNSNM